MGRSDGRDYGTEDLPAAFSPLDRCNYGATNPTVASPGERHICGARRPRRLVGCSGRGGWRRVADAPLRCPIAVRRCARCDPWGPGLLAGLPDDHGLTGHLFPPLLDVHEVLVGVCAYENRRVMRHFLFVLFSPHPPAEVDFVLLVRCPGRRQHVSTAPAV